MTSYLLGQLIRNFRNQSPKKIASILILLVLGISLIAIDALIKNEPLRQQLRENYLSIFGSSIIILVATVLYVSIFIRLFETRVQDADIKNVSRLIKFRFGSFQDHTNNKGIKKSTPVFEKNHLSSQFTDLESLFKIIRSDLDSRANRSEEKASILLDKGIVFAISGIGFLIISMIVWQILFAIYGTKNEFYAGILSCSFIFLFIEFISGWFLKQYKYFVDSAIYLTKIKAIFDKKILAYYAHKENNSQNADHLTKIIEILSSDIRWPSETQPEQNYSKETMESLSSVITALSSELKRTKT